MLIISDGTRPRQKDIRLDFEKLRDVSALLTEGFVEQMKQNNTFSPDVTDRDIEELSERMKKAIVAVTAMFARNRYVEIAIEGAQIVETSGETAKDGRSVKCA